MNWSCNSEKLSEVLEDFQIANEKPSQVSSDHRHTAGWKPPPPRYFKVNVDCALF